jgi:hypothetical protein
MTVPTGGYRPFDPIADGSTRIIGGVLAMLFGLIPFVQSVPSQWESGLCFGMRRRA